jgi:Zn-finger nucleic acid-binding protein
MDIGTLNCPSCGALVSKDATQCQYCHALLRTVACPQCMGMMFAGTKFCPYCGARAEAVAQGTITKRACPRCQAPLQDVKVANTPLEECTRCGGLWVDVSSFDHICSDTEAQTAATGLQLPPPTAVETAVRYLKCPQCNALMNRMNYAGRSGIVINICRPHGIWLDRDEMRLIIEFIRAGGLDKARKLETDELETARKRLENQQSAVSYSPLSDSSYGSMGSNGTADLLTGIASILFHLIR